MLRMTLIAAACLTLAAPLAFAADECCPAEGAKATTVAAESKTNRKQSLPEGHPPLGEMMKRMPQKSPQTGDAKVSGRVTVHAVQATEGADKPGPDAVTVQLYHRGRVLKTLEGKLDKYGVAVFDDVPLNAPVFPVVTVSHAGVKYQAAGEQMAPGKTDQKVRVKVHETTTDRPELQMPMRHVMLRVVPGGLQVQEMLSVANPADRSWVGQADEQGEMRTLSFSLPAGARHVQLGAGFDSCCSKVTEGRIVNAMPVVPGTTKFQFAYVIPAEDQSVDLPLNTDLPVKHMMVFLPAEHREVTVDGLDEMGVMKAGKRQVRVWRGANLPADETASLTVEAIPATAEPTSQPKPEAKARIEADNPVGPRAVAAVGGGVMLVVGAGLVLAKVMRSDPQS